MPLRPHTHDRHPRRSAHRPRRIAGTPGQIALALAIAAFLLFVPGAAGGDGDLRRLHREGHVDSFTLVNFSDFCPHRAVHALVLELGLCLGDVGGLGLGLRPAARLSDHALRLPRRCRRPDARLPAADHAALRRRGRDAALLRPQRLDQPAAGRLVRLQDRLHGGAERRHLRPVGALFPVHPDQSLGGAAQHRPRHGGSGAEPRLLRLSPVPPHRLPACHAGLSRRRLARLRQGLRRSRDAAAAQRQGHAGAAGLSARHLDRHRRPDGLRHLGRADRRLGARHVALGRWR